MAESEQQKATNPEPWREPVPALIENARRAELLDATDDDGTVAWSQLHQLRMDWRNYLALILEPLWGSSNPVAHAIRDARRRLLGKPQSLEPSWQKWKEIGQLNPVTTDPEELERRIDAAEREHKLQLYERRLKEAMRTELREGRWEGENLKGPIPDRMWSFSQFLVDWGNATTQLGKGPLEYGLRLRPRRIEEVPLDQVSVEQSAESGEIFEVRRSTDPDKNPTIEGALTDNTAPQHTAGARDPRRGPLPGRTNWVVQAYEKLVPTLREGRRSGEAYRRAIRRLLREDQLPGTGDLENRIDELARYWAEADRRDGLT